MKTFLAITLALLLGVQSAQALQVNGQLKNALLDKRTAAPSPAAEGQIYYNSSSKKAQLNNGAGWGDIGSGGSGGINYITNADAETNNTMYWGTNTVTITSGWPSTAPSPAPVATPSPTPAPTLWTTTNTNPLAGNYSYKMIRAGSAGAGQVVSQYFTVPRELRASVLTVSFTYEITGTYTDGDLAVGVYSLDGSATGWIQTVPYKILNQTGPAKFQAEFQTTADGTAYALGIIQITTGSWTSVNFDSFFAGKKDKTFGAPVTDWQSFTPVWTASTSNPAIGNGTLSGKYRRVGDSVEVQYYLLAGSTTTYGSGTYRFSLPSGLSIDSNKIAASPHNGMGYGSAYNGELWTLIGRLAPGSSTTNVEFASTSPSYAGTAGTASLVSPTAPFTWASTNALTATVTVPITGWSSSLQMSDNADTRVVALYASGIPTGTLGSSVHDVVFPTVSNDTHSAYNASTGVWTCPVSGYYDISGSFRVTGTFAANNNVFAIITVDGTILIQDSRNAGSSSTTSLSSLVTAKSVKLSAGQQVKIQSYADGSSLAFGAANFSQLSISKVSGPSQIAAGEVPVARYYTAAGQSITNATTPQVNYDTKDYDSHGMITVGASWKATAPMPGIYQVCASIRYASAAWTATNGNTMILFKGGVENRYLGLKIYETTQTMAGPQIVGCDDIKLLAGEYIDIRTSHGESSARALQNSGEVNWITIKRVGNY